MSVANHSARVISAGSLAFYSHAASRQIYVIPSFSSAFNGSAGRESIPSSPKDFDSLETRASFFDSSHARNGASV